MRFRLRYFAYHLLTSAVALGLLLALLYGGWYAWPGWYLSGAELIAGLLIIVDLGVGPTATLIVANPVKPRRELIRDIALIVVLQAVALAYGTHALWAGRPLFYALSGDRFELITAAAIADGDLAAGSQDEPHAAIGWSSRPEWVWAKFPDDPQVAKELLSQLFEFGKDLSALPQYYRPISEAGGAIRAAARPLASMPLSPEQRGRIAELGFTPDAVALVPIEGRTRSGAMLVDPASGRLLEFWPMVIDHPPPANTDRGNRP
jgi:hypothetical protein